MSYQVTCQNSSESLKEIGKPNSCCTGVLKRKCVDGFHNEFTYGTGSLYLSSDVLVLDFRGEGDTSHKFSNDTPIW